MKKNVINQTTGEYLTDDEIIQMALSVLTHRFSLKKTALNSPGTVRDYLRLTLADREHEIFAAVFLDSQHRVIACEEIFRGTLTQTSVYPREIVKASLHHNCAAIIFAHNHPSGVAEPSQSDRMLTDALKQALSLVDVRVLDHFIVAENEILSFAERGII